MPNATGRWNRHTDVDCHGGTGLRDASSNALFEVRWRKDKRGVDLICDSNIVLGGTAALHASGVGGGLSMFRLLSARFSMAGWQMIRP